METKYKNIKHYNETWEVRWIETWIVGNLENEQIIHCKNFFDKEEKALGFVKAMQSGILKSRVPDINNEVQEVGSWEREKIKKHPLREKKSETSGKT